jgi:hypothetical protein
VLRIQDVYPGSRTSDLILSITNPGSRVDKISDPIKDFQYFEPKNRIPGIKVSKIRSGMFKPDPGSWLWIFFHPGSRIRDPGWKKIQIPISGKNIPEIRNGKKSRFLYPGRISQISFPRALNNFLGLVILKFFDADSHPESGINFPDPQH